MTDWGTVIVGGLGIAATVVVAIYAQTKQAQQGQAEREHRLLLAHEARIQERRNDTYVELLTVLNRVMDWVRRTQPLMEPVPDPPPPLPDEELWVVSAKLAAHGSPQVRERLKDFMEARAEFESQAWLLQRARQRGDDQAEHWKAVVDARSKCQERLNEVELAVAEELQQPQGSVP